MDNKQCCVCEKNLGNTYSLRILQDNQLSYTCSYKCNQKVCEFKGKDYWKYVINKTDFIHPVIDKKQENNKEYTFTEHETDIISDPERYENLYEIYLENKKIDEIMDNYSDKTSNYSEDDDY